MLESEISEIVQIAEQYWPNASDAELGLMIKRIKHLFLEDAKNILDEAKMQSRFLTIPMSIIGKQIKKFKRKTIGDRITCFAVHHDTGKIKECENLAQTNDGAIAEMCKWLHEWGMDPTDYAVIPGEESRQLAHTKSRQIQHQLFPVEKETYYRFLAGLQMRGLLKGGAEQAVDDPAALAEALKTATETPQDILPSVPDLPNDTDAMNAKVRQLMASEAKPKPTETPAFDPKVDDGIPF